jgi:hypothetical protein
MITKTTRIVYNKGFKDLSHFFSENRKNAVAPPKLKRWTPFLFRRSASLSDVAHNFTNKIKHLLIIKSDSERGIKSLKTYASLLRFAL